MAKEKSKYKLTQINSKRRFLKTKLSPKCSDLIKIHEDNLTAENQSGYKTVCSDTGTISTQYFEINVIKSVGIRIGFIQSDAEMNGPIGIDSKGYSYGNVNGYKFFNSIRRKYGCSFKEKDIIGALLYRESGTSFIKFYKNGKDLGVAFYNIPHELFYPAVSLYGGSVVNFNFGPYFAYPLDN
ncbi:Set1 Ash2 histone methyltransferase complex [Tubulinosema ratisbonensis]|uniref:Set1 Ash2 histone methyltransferase complex n=1 Tax=Tubulinosema ratisbonensis TaxID=291195 RepID=A0A437AK32_9MICR|nr:Set1 Ash2 histone methyltransferase complex [Tubulinosema ratisbonensis]